ncbi:Uncharacterised protein [Mycobacteroides abscessus subsp. abscessus]|nr:Uncharacterised protein [Mycobacteroides abscessus subsp. abscessus]
MVNAGSYPGLITLSPAALCPPVGATASAVSTPLTQSPPVSDQPGRLVTPETKRPVLPWCCAETIFSWIRMEPPERDSVR